MAMAPPSKSRDLGHPRLEPVTPRTNIASDRCSVDARHEHGVQLVGASSRACTLIESFLRAH